MTMIYEITKEENRIKEVQKLINGSLKVTQNSGNTFEITPDNELFQSFIIYTMLKDN